MACRMRLLNSCFALTLPQRQCPVGPYLKLNGSCSHGGRVAEVRSVAVVLSPDQRKSGLPCTRCVVVQILFVDAPNARSMRPLDDEITDFHLTVPDWREAMRSARSGLD